MAYLPWRPLQTSPDVGAGFVDAFFMLTKTVDAERAPVFGFTKQVCGGSNRNGFLFAQHSDVHQAVSAVRHQRRARPRTAEARRYQERVQEVAGRVEVLPPPRLRQTKQAPLPAASRGRPRRGARPASAPVLRAMDPIKAKGRSPIPPPSFRPFQAFSDHYL